MKTLVAALAAVTSLSIAAPVFACPNHDRDEQTADKDKKETPPTTADKPVQKKDDKVAAPAKDQKPATEKKPAAKG